MQYWKPNGEFYVGDCMPFYHDGVYHLYWLLDEKHHQALGGLGGHQWAHASTRDLVHWEHHPLAIAISAPWEGSICTGSTLYHEGTYYAFYATRRPDRTQHLSLATSSDGVGFAKQAPNPWLVPPPGYSPYDYRDPHVFRDPETGLFHLLVTASLANPPLAGRGGCLAHLVSADLREWRQEEPFAMPGYVGAPECPEHFAWRGWYYLVYSQHGRARYRMSRSPLGPWTRPTVDTFDGAMARVQKTAPFTGDRRIGVAFVPTRQGDRDDGPSQYAGHALFRELVQHPDGTLGTRFPPEMVPTCGDALALPVRSLTGGVTVEDGCVRISAPDGMGAAVLAGVPHNARINLRVRPLATVADYGLYLRSSGALAGGYALRMHPPEQRVALGSQSLACVSGLEGPIRLDIVQSDSIIDVCVDGRRCVVERCPAQNGDEMGLYVRNGAVAFEALCVRALTD
ncbi:MAG: family 43 glycosylhydrolase [Chloroflexi bacterium]|nr:family 43 glycosylhydrolase [Chloroflexota bacterium]